MSAVVAALSASGLACGLVLCGGDGGEDAKSECGCCECLDERIFRCERFHE